MASVFHASGSPAACDTGVVTIASTGGAGATNLGYTAGTRVLTSDTGTDVTLPLVTSGDAGLAPASGGGTSNFLRADGTWQTPAGGGNVSNTGTPTSGQAAEWTSATVVQGVAVTGTGSYVKGTAPTITLPNATGLPLATGVTGILPTANGGTGVDNSSGGTANQFWARPNGATGAATYRAIVAADIPTLNQSTTGSAAA